MPRLPGQDTSVFKEYNAKMQESRKTICLQVDNATIPIIDKLMGYAKKHNLSEHPTKPVNYNSPKGDIKRLIEFSQDHVNFHLSIASGQIRGIVDLDRKCTIRDEDGKVAAIITIRQALTEYVKLDVDGETLFAELHQRGPMGPV